MTGTTLGGKIYFGSQLDGLLSFVVGKKRWLEIMIDVSPITIDEETCDRNQGVGTQSESFLS